MNYPGIIGIKFLIRNKPWIITIDDNFLFDANNQLIFAQPGINLAMWPPIIEKAWAKAIGNYV